MARWVGRITSSLAKDCALQRPRRGIQVCRYNSAGMVRCPHTKAHPRRCSFSLRLVQSLGRPVKPSGNPRKCVHLSAPPPLIGPAALSFVPGGCANRLELGVVGHLCPHGASGGRCSAQRHHAPPHLPWRVFPFLCVVYMRIRRNRMGGLVFCPNATRVVAAAKPEQRGPLALAGAAGPAGPQAADRCAAPRSALCRRLDPARPAARQGMAVSPLAMGPHG